MARDDALREAGTSKILRREKGQSERERTRDHNTDHIWV